MLSSGASVSSMEASQVLALVLGSAPALELFVYEIKVAGDSKEVQVER